MPNFGWNYPASIKRLAEAEGPCPDEGEDVGWKDGVHTEFGYRSFQDMPHLACGGIGRIALFASLRVPSGHDGPSVWVPEPDMEKAVERVVENFAVSTRDEWGWFIRRVFHRMSYQQVGFKEAVLRVAETWVAAKEQHEPS